MNDTLKTGVIWLAIVAACCSIAIGIHQLVGAPDSPFKIEPVEAEYVAIGNDIRRTDDHERGVSCYRVLSSDKLTCVKVK